MLLPVEAPATSSVENSIYPRFFALYQSFGLECAGAAEIRRLSLAVSLGQIVPISIAFVQIHIFESMVNDQLSYESCDREMQKYQFCGKWNEHRLVQCG